MKRITARVRQGQPQQQINFRSGSDHDKLLILEQLGTLRRFY